MEACKDMERSERRKRVREEDWRRVKRHLFDGQKYTR